MVASSSTINAVLLCITKQGDSCKITAKFLISAQSGEFDARPTLNQLPCDLAKQCEGQGAYIGWTLGALLRRGVRSGWAEGLLVVPRHGGRSGATLRRPG